MAVCMVFTPPKDMFTQETYDKVLEHLGDGFPPPAMSAHIKGTTEAGEIRIVDVFESAEAFEAFAESHAPVYEAMGISVDDVLNNALIFEVDNLIK